MKPAFYIISVIIICGIQKQIIAQTPADYAIQLQAQVQVAPPKLTLSWNKIPGAILYNVSRKSKSALFFSTAGTTTDTFYTDLGVSGDSSYEYKVFNTGGAVSAEGYIHAGINAQAIHQRGTLILIADTLFRDSCRAELTQLMQDLSGDGWAVIRHDAGRTMPDTDIKKLIVSDYNTIPGIKAVLLVGHIAVPYSGEIAPDGHPDHIGAWPADVFYGDIDGSWTDHSVNNSSASRPGNNNIPGDGKWDPSVIPSAIELQVSRIDFSDMPAFSKSEVSLMKSYLKKAHQYKTGALHIIHKGVVDDNFGVLGGMEPFAANAWRNFSPLTGRENIHALDLITTLNDSAFQWSYGCGGGSYTSCGGVGITNDFVINRQKGIFTMLFGSYFGDWNYSDNFLRAPLCSEEPTLASFWAGRPNWFLHHMALGEHIGYSTLLTQNQGGSVYTPGAYGAAGIHVALMGDLSLRTDYTRPAGKLSINSKDKSGALLNWLPSPDTAVLGYYVYRSDKVYGEYTRISGLISTATYTDNSGPDGFYYYMVRPCKLQQTPSGTYYNLGLGVTDSATVSFPDPVSVIAGLNSRSALICFPNPVNGFLNIYGNAGLPSGNATITIADMSGRIQISTEYQVHQQEFTFTCNLGHLPAGVYIVSLRINDAVQSIQKVYKL